MAPGGPAEWQGWTTKCMHVCVCFMYMCVLVAWVTVLPFTLLVVRLHLHLCLHLCDHLLHASQLQKEKEDENKTPLKFFFKQ